METTTLDSGYASKGNSGLTTEGERMLESAAKWARFLAILGFIGIGCMIIFAFLAGTIFSQLNTLPANFPGYIFTIIYLVVAALYFFPVLFLFRFANATLSALRPGSEVDIEQAFRFLNLHYKVIGIMAIVGIAFYIIVIVGAIGSGAFLS